MGTTLRTIEAALWLCALAVGIGFVSLYAEGTLPALFKGVKTASTPNQRERIQDLLGPAGTPRQGRASSAIAAQSADAGRTQIAERSASSSAPMASALTDLRPMSRAAVLSAPSKDPVTVPARATLGEVSAKKRNVPAPKFFPAVRSGWPFELTPAERSGDAAPERSRYAVNGAAIYFPFGSSELSSSAREALDKAADEAVSKPNTAITVRGFTDGVGPVRGNATLSELRAKSVSRYLIARGIDPRRISLFGLGPQNSFVSNETAPGRALNRRVEVLIGD